MTASPQLPVLEFSHIGSPVRSRLFLISNSPTRQVIWWTCTRSEPVGRRPQLQEPLTGMQRDVAVQLQKRVALRLLIIPETRLDPLVPPTLTPRPAAIASPVGTPTTAPTPTTTSLPTVQPSPTATPTPMPTRTPQPTTVPTAVATAGPSPPAHAVVGATGRQGANIHREPGLGDVLDAVSDGTIIQLTGNTADSSGFVWREVILPDGRVGWLAAQYLVPYDTNQAP